MVLKGRKATNKLCGLIFIGGFICHLAIGVYFTMTETVFVVTVPSTFVSSGACSAGNCSFAVGNCAEGLARVSDNSNVLSDCINPCPSEYMWKEGSQLCVHRKSIAGHEKHGHCVTLKRRLDSASDYESEEELNAFQNVLENNIWVYGGWFIAMLVTAIAWYVLILGEQQHFTSTLGGAC